MTSSARVIPFVKANACGNDFLIIDGVYFPADIAEFSRRICDRHHGVGADGVEWLFPATDADVQARLFNADGSEAEISGNGTRCVAAYLCSEEAPEKRFAIRTGAGIKTCMLTSHSESQYEFETAMGEPQVGDELPIQLAFAGSARHSSLHGKSALRRFCAGIRSRLAGRSGRNRATSRFKQGLMLNW